MKKPDTNPPLETIINTHSAQDLNKTKLKLKIRASYILIITITNISLSLSNTNTAINPELASTLITIMHLLTLAPIIILEFSQKITTKDKHITISWLGFKPSSIKIDQIIEVTKTTFGHYQISTLKSKHRVYLVSPIQSNLIHKILTIKSS